MVICHDWFLRLALFPDCCIVLHEMELQYMYHTLATVYLKVHYSNLSLR